AIMPDSRVVVGGSIKTPTRGYDFAVVRLTASGMLDTSFNADGIAAIDFGDNQNDVLDSLLLEGSGSIVLAGRSVVSADRSDPILSDGLARLTASGDLDHSFGGDGISRSQ